MVLGLTEFWNNTIVANWNAYVAMPFMHSWENVFVTGTVKTTNLMFDIGAWVASILGYLSIVAVLIGGLVLLYYTQELVKK